MNAILENDVVYGWVNDDGTAREDVAAVWQEIDQNRKHRERVLARMTPLQRRLLERRYATNRAHVSTSRPAPVAPATVPRRTHGPSGRPRAQASRSSARRCDSGDDDPEPEPPLPRTTQRWRRVKSAWAEREHRRLNDEFEAAVAGDEPWLPCPFCGQVLVEEVDGTHCGGCRLTFWEGVR